MKWPLIALAIAQTSLRANTHVLRDLTGEAPRAELRAPGLIIDLGTPDAHKYVDPTSGRISFYERSTFDRISIRAHASGRRRTLSVSLDGTRIGVRTVDRGWRTVELVLPRAAEPGFHTLSFGSLRGIEIDWIQIGPASAAAPPLAKVDAIAFGTPRRALIADPPRTLSYYLEVPEQGRLLFDYGAQSSAVFSIELTADGEETRRIFAASGGGGRWREGEIDLSDWAGRMVRLDLSTDGAATRAAWGEPQIVRAGGAPSPSLLLPGSAPRNVVVILIDTVRQDAFTAFNPKTLVQTPRFSDVAGESTLFTRAYTTAAWTKPSVASVLSSLHPSTHGALTEESMLPQEVELVSEHLQARGFTTAMFSANGYVSDRFGFDQGWDHYFNFVRSKRSMDAEVVYADALRWLESVDREQRFFLYVQTIDPHVPYRAPDPYLEKYFGRRYRGRLGGEITGYETADFNAGRLALGAEDREYLIAQYFGEISYHDDHFGRFVDRLRELDLLDSTLLIVTNDHGEELFDRGRIGHAQSLHDELVRSPLLIRAPATFPPATRVEVPVSGVDLAPTMLEALGVDALPGAEGLSLVGAVHGRPALVPPYAISERGHRERSIRLGSYALIASAAKVRLFDLSRDPTEKEDVAAERPIALRTLQIHLREGLAVPKQAERLTGAGPVRRYKSRQAVIDRELREHLEALGYLND